MVAGEGFGADSGDRVRDGDGGELVVEEGAVADSGDRVRDGDGGELVADEGRAANTGDRVRDGDGGEFSSLVAVVPPKGLVANSSHGYSPDRRWDVNIFWTGWISCAVTFVVVVVSDSGGIESKAAVGGCGGGSCWAV